jgi:hypothetical protein
MKISVNVAVSAVVAVTGALLYAWHPAVGIGYAIYLIVVPRGTK